MKKEIYTIIAALMCGACADKATYDACGTFEAEEILVSSQGTGQLIWFDVREGAQVEPGVVLGVVDIRQNMRRKQHRGALADRQQRIKYFFSADGIQRRGRLVADKQARAVQKCLRDTKSLLHAARKAPDAAAFLAKSNQR